MNEERFLRSRKEREAVREEKRADDDDDGLSEAKVSYTTRMNDTNQKVLAAVEKREFEGAKEAWRDMQVVVRSAVEQQLLSSREQELANALLADLLSSIQTSEGQQTTKKFKFSSKDKVRSGPAVVATAPADVKPSPAPEPKATPQAGDQVISGKSNCKVFVPTAKAVFIENCTNCTIYALPTEGSLFISKSVGTTIFCAPHQLRMFECSNINVYTWCRSIPVIEGCTGMVFGGYSAWTGLEDPEAKVREAGQNDLEWSKNSHKAVDDFHWLKQSASPHWKAIPEAEWALDTTPFTPQ